MSAGFVLLVQVCLAPAAGGQVLRGCETRTWEAHSCEAALEAGAALLAPDRVAVPGPCVRATPPRRQLPEPPRRGS